MSYTPGPWKHKPSIYGTKYRYVQIGREKNYTTAELILADARLISAAPDLYEALQEIVDAADGAGWNQLDATFTRARSALKKARGER
jgi:hypothetical protein